jgi:PqqD family protein of HPr-rel-A system
MLEFIRDGTAGLTIYRLVSGLRLECLDKQWVAFSPESGETLLMNTEAASVLDVLSAGAMSDSAVCDVLSAETDVPRDEVADSLRSIWPQMLSAGFVKVSAAPADNGG